MSVDASPLPGGEFAIAITPHGVRGRPARLSGAPRAVIHSLHKTFHLIRLDLHQASFGLYLGNLWLLLEPALQAGAYYFLLKVVFNVGGADSTFAFFFIGITFWRSHATLVASAPYFLSTKGHQYVEQGFGLPIAFMEVVANEVLLLVMRLAVLALFLVVAGYPPQWSWPLVVPVVLVQFTFSMALHVWLSMVGVVVKDSGRFIGHIVWLWWYMSPGLYSIRRIPEWADAIYNLNPFAHLIPAYHSILLQGVLHLSAIVPLSAILGGSLILLWLGLLRLRVFSYSMAQYV